MMNVVKGLICAECLRSLRFYLLFAWFWHFEFLVRYRVAKKNMSDAQAQINGWLTFPFLRLESGSISTNRTDR